MLLYFVRIYIHYLLIVNTEVTEGLVQFPYSKLLVNQAGFCCLFFKI